MSINKNISEVFILRKKRHIPSHFHDVIEIENICFMLKGKSFSDPQRTEVFDGLLLDRNIYFLNHIPPYNDDPNITIKSI